MFGLRDSDIEYITKQVEMISNIEKVSIFGSRAKGTYRENSDIDIVVYGNNIDKPLIFRLYEILEEDAPYPFFVDIVDYTSADEVLKSEIDKYSVVLYVRNS